MQVPYIERLCKQCPLKGVISETAQDKKIKGIRYIECQRDNKDAKEHFLRTLKDENFSWLRQVAEPEHCIYAYQNETNETLEKHKIDKP